MKTLNVPKQPIGLLETVLEKIKMIFETGAVAQIEVINWKDEYPKSFPVTVRIAHDGERLFLYYTIEGEVLRAVAEEDFGPVWEDSCVEFFMQREGEKMYRNFECNAIGVLLASKREDKESAQKLSVEDMASIVRQSFISRYYKNDKQLSDWSLYLEIPKKAMGFSVDETLDAQKIRANFYKCGDETPEPHFISWSPIDTPAPNFHVPQFFGVLELE